MHLTGNISGGGLRGRIIGLDTLTVWAYGIAVRMENRKRWKIAVGADGGLL